MPARRRNPPSRAAHPSSVGPLLAARPPAQPWDGTHGCDGPRRFARVMKRIGSADRSGPASRDALRRCASPDAPSRALPARRGDDRPPPDPRRLRCSAAPARPGAPILTSLREPKVCAGGGPRRCGALSTRRSTPVSSQPADNPPAPGVRRQVALSTDPGRSRRRRRPAGPPCPREATREGIPHRHPLPSRRVQPTTPAPGAGSPGAAWAPASGTRRRPRRRTGAAAVPGGGAQAGSSRVVPDRRFVQGGR